MTTSQNPLRYKAFKIKNHFNHFNLFNITDHLIYTQFFFVLDTNINKLWYKWHFNYPVYIFIMKFCRMTTRLFYYTILILYHIENYVYIKNYVYRLFMDTSMDYFEKNFFNTSNFKCNYKRNSFFSKEDIYMIRYKSS